MAVLALEHDRVSLDQQPRPVPRPLLLVHGEQEESLHLQVLISTVTFIISTADELQKDASGNSDFPWVVFIIEMIDNFVVIFFTIEFIIRLVVCPNKARWITFSNCRKL